MYRDNGFGLRRYGRFQLPPVQVVGFRFDIHKHRLGLQTGNTAGSGDERERNRDDLVTAVYTQRHQRQQQSVGSRGTTNSETAANIFRDLGFELTDFGPHDEALALQHRFHCGQHLFSHSRELSLQVDQGKELPAHDAFPRLVLYLHHVKS